MNPIPLTIEIQDDHNVSIRQGEKVLGGIQALRFSAAVHLFPNLLEISVLHPETEGISKDFGEIIQNTIEVIKQYGGSVRFVQLEDIAIPQNPEEQKQAEAALKQVIQCA